MIKSVTDTHVYALLSPEAQISYEVPKYQREYSWSKNEWDALFDDLLAAEGEHFLGTIICINTTSEALAGSTLELVDGQQRMTTLSLLLAAIYDLLRRHRNGFDDDDIALLSKPSPAARPKGSQERLAIAINSSAAGVEPAGLPQRLQPVGP